MNNIEKIDIHELLPQHEPFVMVGEIVHFDLEKTVTRTRIKPDNLFVENGRMSAYGLIENIAQTCAARIGYYNKIILRKGVQIGFIGAIRNLIIHRLPMEGETIETTILTLEEIFGMTLIRAYVKVAEDIIAESEMKIALEEDTDIKPE